MLKIAQRNNKLLGSSPKCAEAEISPFKRNNWITKTQMIRKQNCLNKKKINCMNMQSTLIVPKHFV